MPASKAKRLSSLLQCAIKSSSRRSALPPSIFEDGTLKQFVSALDPSSASSSQSSPNSLSVSVSVSDHFPSPKYAADVSFPTLNFDADAAAAATAASASESDYSDAEEDSMTLLSEEISSVLSGGTSSDSKGADDDKPLERVLKIPWFLNLSNGNISVRRKEASRERKQKWVFKSTQFNRFDRLVNMCAQKLGSEATLKVFGKLGRESGLKEYNALIKICIKKARKSDDEDVALEQVYNAYQLLQSMKDQGFQLEESTYGPFLTYLIEMSWIEEFKFFCDLIKDENPISYSKLGYYEMLLWIRINNEEKIQELCEFIAADDEGDKSDLRENYLLALCESDRKKELLQLLEIIDIKKISSLHYLARIFESLGKLKLESFAEKFLLVFKTDDNGAGHVSNFIFYYASGIPNLAVEETIIKFKDLHKKLEIPSSSSSLEKLIRYCCDSSKVHMALDIVDEMCESGLSLSIKTLHSIMDACAESYEFTLVRRIYSIICDNKLTPNSETFRSMISLSIRMKDFDGAYSMLNDMKKMNLTPTASMYNAIMGGYFREKDTHGALMVLKKMELADVKPDSQTFSYLINNCDCEEDIIKYYEELKQGGISLTKQVFMSLINAYASCGQFEKAKQVVLDKGIPLKFLNEIKSVLVSALASHGQMSDALDVYEEIKQAGCNLEPKAIISLIEHVKYDGELTGLLHLLEELNGSDYWDDGCCRVIMYCVRHKHLRAAVDLLKQLKDNNFDDELDMDSIFEEACCIIADEEPGHLQVGLDLLQVIKDEFGISPSRKCLDFLHSACVSAGDLQSALLIWKEYREAGLAYNVLSYLRMYQVLLASGDENSADIVVDRIPQDDIHVRRIIRAYQKIYKIKGKKKKKQQQMSTT